MHIPLHSWNERDAAVIKWMQHKHLQGLQWTHKGDVITKRICIQWKETKLMVLNVEQRDADLIKMYLEIYVEYISRGYFEIWE